MKAYESLQAWQACHALVLSVYRNTVGWPPEERFGLVSQARRAAFSAAANIAEGSAKRGHREFRRFLDIALGSLSELSYILRLAQELKILVGKPAQELQSQREEAGKLTWGLYDYVRKKT